MAAYAALVSVMHIVDQIEHHPSPPITLNKNQVQSLTKKVTFLQVFLEGYKPDVGYNSEADAFEMRIADAAYAAEDAVESRILDQIHAESSRQKSVGLYRALQRATKYVRDRIHGKRFSSVDLYKALQRVMEDMDSLVQEAIAIKERMTGQHQPYTRTSVSSGSLRSSSTMKNTAMVEFDDVSLEIMEKLTGGELDRRIIPIVGMGGIGKTTLARNLYAIPLVTEHFDISAWATISQEYDAQGILREILSQFKKEGRGDSTENELGEMLYKHLWGRRYLIVMDDMWSVEAWDSVKFFFPDNNNGSRIMVTTRITNLAFQLTSSPCFQIKFLDEDKSWNLLCQIVFGKEDCPVELVKIGKKIVKICKGLPLSIGVMGGLLSKYERTCEFWEYALENITSSTINLEDDEHCLKILYMSYRELPVHLKPCFLYMGIFQEDEKIRVSELIKLWVAEGFLKPVDGKILEEVATEYFTELVDRNLILVERFGTSGNIKLCKIHDILRDLCLREAQKQKFLCVIELYNLSSPSIRTQRRILIRGTWGSTQVCNALKSTSLARSVIVQYTSYGLAETLRSVNLRFLRVLKAKRSGLGFDFRFTEHELYNLRYVSTFFDSDCLQANFYWNLQTLCTGGGFGMDSEFWTKHLLRHVKLVFYCLPDPPNGHIVLENLQTLSSVGISECREKVFEGIPNLKKLEVTCLGTERESLHCFSNLGHLRKLEHLKCYIRPYSLISCTYSFKKKFKRELQRNIAFPRSLKKLTLIGSRLNWKDITAKIGALPLLQVLKLEHAAASGPDWVTVEGQFGSLKFLLIDCCFLEHWTTDETHFPRLEHLCLKFLKKLTEIPSSIGEIPTLETIRLEGCRRSVDMSAKRIQEEQEELGNEGLRVYINQWGPYV